MLRKTRASGRDPLFSWQDTTGSQRVPLTYSQLSDKYKEWVQRTGISPDRHTLHGLRQGGACHGLQVGLVGEELKILGDWALEAYMRYLDLSLQQRVDCMVQFMGEL